MEYIRVLMLYDNNNHAIRRVKFNDGKIDTIVGILGMSSTNPTAPNGDDGDSNPVTLSYPAAIALDLAGDLLIADTGNRRIRKLSTDGTVSTFAGSGAAGSSGDNGPATSATAIPAKSA